MSCIGVNFFGLHPSNSPTFAPHQNHPTTPRVTISARHHRAETFTKITHSPRSAAQVVAT